MRVVIQKITHASVDIEKQTVASINKGLLVLVGIEDSDTDEDIAWLSAKIVNLRVFEDENGVIPIYEAFVRQVETLLGKQVPTGQFGAMMQVNLCNDGPVTILIDTKNKDF